MKISILANNKSIFGVDYSKRKDCIGVFEITENEAEKIQKGCKVKVVKNKLQITETKEYLENIKQEKLEKAKKQVSEKIYSKYDQGKQSTILYETLFLFLSRMLEDADIKAKFSDEELKVFENAQSVFLDMKKDLEEYYKEKEIIINN